MEMLKARKYEFVSKALPEDTFAVVNFDGTEGLSTCYRFEINLSATDPDIDMKAVLRQPAVFTILREDGDIPFHGILAEFEQRQAFNDYVFYRAVLVPRFWWLQLTFHNQVFLDQKIPDVLEAVLKDGGLTVNDFELRLQRDYPDWEYVCQYQESHFHFASRWMEREGIYYFFEQTPNGEKLILTDTTLAHTPMPEGQTMYYSPPSGLDETHREEVMHSYVCRQKMLPQKVILKDYNYRTPSLEMKGEADALQDGRGEVFIYGEHFRTPEEGSALARIRAEELLCREKLFLGESTIPFLRPGYVFDLEDHYRGEYNQKYLTTELHHQGSQTAYLISGIRDALAQVEEKPYYRNSFTTIPQSIQFRPERLTPASRFFGAMNARIDAAGSGKYAELDDQGRYKVILPFDLSGRQDGKASAFLRMAQPYAGTDHGMHFPLHKDTEVLLTFIDGNPDRPIVAAAVPNPVTPSPVHSGNQTMSHITTGGQNKLHFEDQEGGQRALLFSPTSNSWFRVGAPNDPPPTSYVEDSDSSSNGIRIHSDGNLWLEAKEKYANYRVGVPQPSTDAPSNIQYLIDKMYNFTADTDFKPTGVERYSGSFPGSVTSDLEKWQYLVSRGENRIAKGDTFITQDGNIYDFGGYWNYNLGNCYIENHIDQAAELNADYSNDLLNEGGPGWSSWSEIEKTGGTIKNELKDNDAGDWDNGEVWVEKKFGETYEYNKGAVLTIQEGSTQEVNIGRGTLEESYLGTGQLLSRSVGGLITGGESESWTYCRDYGTLMTWSWSKKGHGTLNTRDFTWENKSAASFSFSSSASFSFSLAASFSLSIAASASVSIDLNSSQSIDIKVPFISIFSLSVTRGGGMKLEIPGASLDVKPPAATVVIEGAPAKVKLKAGTAVKVGQFWLKVCSSAAIDSNGLVKCIL